MNKNKIITVFGGSGFVGRYIVEALAKTGARIRVAVRNPNNAHFTTVYGTPGQVVPIFCNVRDYQSVKNAVEGADIVINAVGILYQTGRQRFDNIHSRGSEHIAHACMQAETDQLIHLSAIGAAENSMSHYARSKGYAESHIKQYFPKAVILRPSIVFGPEDNFFNLFASFAGVLPVLPLIGGGHTQFQPVYVRDIADAVTKILSSNIQGKTYELGGSEIFTFKELMEKILIHIGKKRVLMPLPFWAANIKASILQWFPKPLLTTDQVILLKMNNVVTPDMPCLKDLNITPTLLNPILKTYLCRFRKGGDYNIGSGYDYKSQDDL